MKHADCDRVRPLLSPRLDRELTAETEQHVSAHLAACSECREELGHIERGRGLATLLPDLLPPASFRRELLQRLRRTAHAAAPRPIWRRPAFALAIVAVGLLATAVEHVTIAGPPCERLHIRGHEIIKWERGGTRSIMVGVADNPEVAKIAHALISATS